tara:strand:+ start:8297 stop:15352 length:7056 start_codon:yes stop_codon:yes gene_type:complete
MKGTENSNLMATYQELVDLYERGREEEEEEEVVEDSFLPPPQPMVEEEIPEAEARRLHALTLLNNYKQDHNTNKRFNREEDGTFVPATKRTRSSTPVESITEEFSLDDLEDPSHFLHEEWTARTNRFLEGLGTLQQDASVRRTKDIFEYLRDEKWSTTRTITRAFQNRQWTPDMMEDYRFIRQVFDKAKLGGTRQIVEATKDISIDLLADPMNIVTAVASMFTAGAGGAAVQAGARGVAAMAGRQALAQSTRTKAKQLALSPTWEKTLQGMSIGMTEGALDGNLINAATQISERQTGLRNEDFSWGELATATGAGAILGAGLGGSVARVGSAIARRGHAKAMGRNDISFPEEVLDQKTGRKRPTEARDIERFRKASYAFNKGIAATLGKATTRYIHVAEAASPKLKNFIELVRYDAFKGILDDDMIDKVVKPSYNIRREMREGKLRTTADKFISRVIHGGRGLLGKHSFYNIEIDPLANKQLLGLLSDDHNFNLEKLYKQYYNIKPGQANRTMDGTLKSQANKVGRIKLYGEFVSPEVIGAAFHIRRAMDDAHNQGSFIDTVGTDGKIGEVTSLFGFGKKQIKNYMPRVWIYDALELQKNKIVDLLVKTKHTDLLEGTFPKVKGKIADNDVELNVETGTLQKRGEDGEFRPLTPDEAESIVITSTYDTESGKWITTKNEEFEFVLSQQLDYDQSAFSDFLGDHKSFRELAEARNPNASTEEIKRIARRLKGEALVDKMISGKYDLSVGQANINSDRTGFTQARAFSELNTMDLADLGVIETDVKTIFSDYMHKVSSAIERTALFGNTKSQFAERWQKPIQEELLEARKSNPDLTIDIINEITGGAAGRGDDSGLMKLYSRVTGLESSHIKNPFARAALDGAKVSMRLAYLPLATLSSITEPMIALSRADLADTPKFIKEFSLAAGRQFTKGMKRALRSAQVAGGREVRGVADLSDEAWMDFYQAGIAAEHAMEERLKGLYGEYHTKSGRWISQQFFKYNLLIPWTQAVQMGAYNFSNARVTRILGDLDRGSNFMGQKLSERAILRRGRELREIGINPKEALQEYKQYVIPEITTETITPKGRAWARFNKKDRKIYVNETELQKRYENKSWTKPRTKGVEALPEDQFQSVDEFRQFIYSHERHHSFLLQRRGETKGAYENRINQAALNNMDLGRSTTGSFRQSDWKQSDYYDHSITPASSLFAREIILNPAVAEANTPLWFQNPSTQLFVQFMGYPTAFNNIVLKNMARGIIKNPMVNGSKALAATTLMTGTAMLANMLRSHGDSLDLPEGERVAEGLRRWGAFGPLEYAYRWKQGQKYGGYGMAPILKAGTGPLPGKIIDSLQYHQTPFEFLGTAIPGWAALSPEQRKEWRQYLRKRSPRGSFTEVLGLRRPIQKRVRGGFKTGGVVDIDNAVSEPDERIDRMTGLPYNIQAGAAFQDEEDRVHFIVGGLASKLAATLLKAGNKKGLRTRERYLNEEHLDSLGGKSAEPFKQEVSLLSIKKLLEDGEISTKEAARYLRAAKYRRHTIRKFLRPYKEVGITGNVKATDIDFYSNDPDDFLLPKERTGFAEGSLVEEDEEIRELSDKEKARFKVQENDMYRLLTRDEEEYATLDRTELSLYSEEDLKDLEIEQTFYTALPEDSRKANLEAYRDSKTIGLKVSESPVQGDVKLAGKIHFKNVLNLNVDEVTPAAIEKRLSVIKAGNTRAEPFLVDEIIDSMKYHLGVRDTVLEMDDELTKDKEDVIEQSKSFILRHGLLKLGYDAIKYNNGYVLLRENQFMPTEILGRERANKGGLINVLNQRRGRVNKKEGGLINTLKRRRARFSEGGDPKSNFLDRLQSRAYEAWKNNVGMEKRLYLQTLFGDRDKPFTKEDFTEKELMEIASVIAGPAREQLSRFENRHEQYDSLMATSDRNKRSAQNLPELISQFTELSKTDPELAAYREASEGPRKDELFNRLISKHGDLLDTVPYLSNELRRKKLFNMDEEYLNAISLDKELDLLESKAESYRQMASDWMATEEEAFRTRREDVQYGDYADEQGPNLGGLPFVSGDAPEESQVGTTLGRFTYDIDPGVVNVRDEYDFDQGLYKQYEGLGFIDKALAVANQLREDFSEDKSNPQSINTTGRDKQDSDILDLSKPFYNPIQQIAQVIGEAYIGDEGRPVDIQIPTEGYSNWFPQYENEEDSRQGFKEGGDPESNAVGEAEDPLIEIVKKSLREKEGLEYEAYKPVPEEEHFTIGYGHYGPDVKEGQVIDEAQAEKYLDTDVRIRVEEARKLISPFDQFPVEVQGAIMDEFYRGSIRQSPQAVELINQGRYAEAANEYLDNDEYRRAEELGKSGIRPRMERVADALRSLEN